MRYWQRSDYIANGRIMNPLLILYDINCCTLIMKNEQEDDEKIKEEELEAIREEVRDETHEIQDEELGGEDQEDVSVEVEDT